MGCFCNPWCMAYGTWIILQIKLLYNELSLANTDKKKKLNKKNKTNTHTPRLPC